MINVSDIRKELKTINSYDGIDELATRLYSDKQNYFTSKREVYICIINILLNMVRNKLWFIMNNGSLIWESLNYLS